MQPLISVIVPIYKVEKYLNSCVESLINQTYKNLEIILVDDGSPDNCSHMCDEWAIKDGRIKVIHKENGGLSDARNSGLKMATGEYIVFVDSDDLVSLYFVEYLYNAALSTGSELAACEVEDFSSEGQLTEMTSFEVTTYSAEQALAQLIKGKGFRAVAWNKLYHASLLKNEQFEFGKLHEDEFFTYRILDKCHMLVFVAAPLYKYRKRDGSIMSVKSDAHLDSLEAYLQRLMLFQKKYPDLYHTDKITFCVSCFNNFCYATHGGFDNSNNAKRKIIFYRNQVHFTFKEMMKMDFRSKYYVIASVPPLIHFFCKFRKRNKGF